MIGGGGLAMLLDVASSVADDRRSGSVVDEGAMVDCDTDVGVIQCPANGYR